MKSIRFRRAKYKLNYNLSRINIFKYIILFFLIICVFLTLNIYEKTFKPQIKELAKNKAYYIMNIAINEGVADVLNKNNLTYNDLVTFMKDSSGGVTAIMTNLITINRLKTEFSLKISEKIRDIKETTVSIPLGNLSGMEILSGLGPRFKISLVPTASTLIDFENSFVEAGINQTRHEIYLKVDSNISMLMPNGFSTSVKVAVSF